jgi:hypothetical protein
MIDIDDGIWGLAQPEFPEFRAWHLARARAQAGRGGDRFVGRRLGRILRAAGYVEVELDLFAYDSDKVGIEALAAQLSPEQFLPLLEGGGMTLDDYIRACAATRSFLESDNHFLWMVGVIARGEKPR